MFFEIPDPMDVFTVLCFIGAVLIRVVRKVFGGS